jgi:hypothetical protein
MIRFSPLPNRANVIQWREWGADAFEVAGTEEKPIMVFVAAFWCRYCQRMDEEAFSEDDVIALLNAFFVSIRVEEGQRPDVSLRYNLNGWPTVAFITPQGELLAVTNYQPRETFASILARVYKAHQDRKGGEAPAAGEREVERSATAPVAASSKEGMLLDTIEAIFQIADAEHGGYGHGQKFIMPEANDFLLSVYESTREPRCLDHVRSTLDRMRAGAIYDEAEGGYFRTCSNPDWSRPHREKLLREQAGMLRNCLRAFRITRDAAYARMAGEIIDYLDRRLSTADGPLLGCEDFLRNEIPEPSGKEYFAIIDRCLYTDANADAALAYLEAGEVLRRGDLVERARKCLDFLWEHCASEDGAVCHSYFDGRADPFGLLMDQSALGTALIEAYRSTGNPSWLNRARLVGGFIENRLKNSDGGYFDSAEPGPGYLRLRLTLIEQNGAAASFFLRLAQATSDMSYRDDAAWALEAFNDPGSHGIHAAAFGRALNEFLYGIF